MMDISDAMRGPIDGGEGRSNEVVRGEGAAFEDVTSNASDSFKNLKRKLDDDYANSKKRRKQLKPIRIATNLDEMVKVPKQITSLNIDNMSQAVPKETSSNSVNSQNYSVNDVHITKDEGFPSESHNPDVSIGRSGIEPEKPDLNVPNLDVGPNFITNPNFIYPFSFGRPVRNPNFWSDANLKIFNHEAYCDLCKKEFCNKYFLKTHKANKHGIYVDFPTTSKGKIENGKSFVEDCERAFCELCNKRFCNKYFVRRHKTKSHGLPDDENQFGLNGETNQVQIPTNSTKNTVNIVDKLGLIAKEDNQACEVQETPLNLIVKEGSDDDHDDDEEGEEEEEEEGEEEEEERKMDGDDCSSENIEKLETMLLRLNPSEVDGKSCKMCQEVVDGPEHKCGEISEANDSSNESKNDLQSPGGGDFMFRLDAIKQMKPTSSYCEICNKELCNKYFMRTHMQRMHGIEIEHGTQIGGVVCNICNKELCSKYFLRVHKQNTHGIISPNSIVSASTSQREPKRPERLANASQVCYICNKRFRSPKWLQAHFLSDHKDEGARQAPGEDAPNDDEEGRDDDAKAAKKRAIENPEPVDVMSKLFWENNSTAKSYNCSQCPFTTSVLAFLFVHERSHYVIGQEQSPEKPPVSLQSLLADHTFWQTKITNQISECLDLSSGNSKYLSFEQNGS